MIRAPLTLVVLTLTLALGSQAHAETFCAERPGDATCAQNFMGTSTAIQAAVAAADTNPGPDTVRVGTGNFVMPSPVYLDNLGANNKLTLIGSGNATVLSGSNPADPDIHFNGDSGSSINSLTISIPDDPGSEFKTGLILEGEAATAADLHVTFASQIAETPTTGNRTTGVRLTDGGILRNSTVTLYNTNVNDAVDVFGSGKVLNSTLTAFRGVDQSNSTGTVEVRNSALVAIGVGAQTLGGTMKITDSVILNPFGSGDGVFVRSSGTYTEMQIDGTTMVGAAGSVGAVVDSAAGSPDPANARFRLTDSVIYGHDSAIASNVSLPEDTLNIDVNSSAYDPTRVSSGGAGTPGFDIRGLVDLDGIDPGFLDPGNGDYSLSSGSPLIDLGRTAAPPPGSLDFIGNPRACDGDGDGSIRRDIGAFEYRAAPNDNCTAPKVIGLRAPRQTKLVRVGIRFRSDEPGVTFVCRLNKAPFRKCRSPWKSPKLKKGRNVVQVQATDAAGNRSKIARLTIRRKA